ncbi:MAG TPA: hypothetical protein VFZ59_09905 [Verrucomicrobiae bacterium]|nr:hypothetical protein [Verrucomicrobiae bacterium]
MRIGLPLRLEDPIDQTTFDNLMEWQCAMACWSPQKLKVVPIRCPIEPEPAKPDAASGRGALAAFQAEWIVALQLTATPLRLMPDSSAGPVWEPD